MSCAFFSSGISLWSTDSFQTQIIVAAVKMDPITNVMIANEFWMQFSTFCVIEKFVTITISLTQSNFHHLHDIVRKWRKCTNRFHFMLTLICYEFDKSCSQKCFSILLLHTIFTILLKQFSKKNRVEIWENRFKQTFCIELDFFAHFKAVFYVTFTHNSPEQYSESGKIDCNELYFYIRAGKCLNFNWK